MIEIKLEDFEDFYKKSIDSQFSKIKRATNKLISEIRENLVDIKICMDHFLEAGEGKIENKAQKSLNFFIDRIKKEIDEIQIPESEINYDNVNQLFNSIKKLFPNINDIARKSLPKFQREVQPQIKELNYITRKLSGKQKDLNQFLRKKYTELKDAEDLLKRLPKLFSLRENIEKARAELDSFENEYEEKKELLNKLNSDLVEIERNDIFKKLEAKNNDLFKLRLSINEEIGFKKALKKLKFGLEHENITTLNVDLNHLREFLKNPIKTLVSESDRSDFPKFSNLMVQLRHALEENKLNLKTDTKDKTIEQINAIFDERKLQNNIENYLKIKEEIKQIKSEVEKQGLGQKLEELKNQISITSVKLEHIEHDLNRKNNDYTKYLSNLKEEREEFQTLVKEVIREPVKIEITFTF